jgi:hypothetical protein
MKSSGFNGCPPVGAQIVRPRVFAVFRGKIFGKARHAGRCRCRSTPQTLKIPSYKQKQQNRRAASALLAARRLLV